MSQLITPHLCFDEQAEEIARLHLADQPLPAALDGGSAHTHFTETVSFPVDGDAAA